MIGLGAYLQYKYRLDHADPPVAPVAQWFPVFCIFMFTIACTLGYLVVPWVMIGMFFKSRNKICKHLLNFPNFTGELYPQKVRGLVGGMTTFAAHTFVFLVVKTYPLLSHLLHQHGTFILYGCISMFGKQYQLVYGSKMVFAITL